MDELLSDNEKAALKMFKEQLQKKFSDRFDSLVLFGSKARGESAKHSDVDVLVVLKHNNWRDQWPVAQIASRVSLDTDVDLSVKVVSPEAVQRLRQRRSPLMLNIDRDSVFV